MKAIRALEGCIYRLTGATRWTRKHGLPSVGGVSLRLRRTVALSAALVLALIPSAYARINTHETGSYDSIEQSAPRATYEIKTASDETVSDYTLNSPSGKVAKARFDGSSQSDSWARGNFEIDAPDGYDGYYGAAFYFPTGTFSGSSPKQKGRIDVIRWDNKQSFPTDWDWGGIRIDGSDHKAHLVRGTTGTSNYIGDPFALEEGCWNWIFAHQKFGQSGAVSEVFLNGVKVVDSAAPNSFGRVTNHVRYGLVGIDEPAQYQQDIQFYVDDAYEEPANGSVIPSRAHSCLRRATHETGDTSEYDARREASFLTYRASQEKPAYEGAWEAKANFDATSTAGAETAGGAFRIDAPTSSERYYGAAFYFPNGTFTGLQPSQKGRNEIMRWDNYATYPGAHDFGGILLSNVNHQAYLFRSSYATTVVQDIIGDGLHLGEGCWNWLVVHQKFSDKPATDPDHAVNEVFLNGTRLVNSTAPNNYGRIANDVRFGLPYLYPGVQDAPLSVYVDNAYTSKTTRVSPNSNICTPPQTTITSGPSGTGNGAGGQFDFSSSRPGSTFECRVDSSAWTPCSSPHYVSGVRDGQRVFKVRAIDAANNMDRTPASWTWTADGEADDDSSSPAISGDGRFVAFESDASNLVEGDTNGQRDIFVENRLTRTFERISVASGGAQANGPSYDASISYDGRLVAFRSDATNLVAGDMNRVSDVFVYNRFTGAVRRASVTNTGAEIGSCPPLPQSCSSTTPAGTMPSISGDGRYVAFVSEQGPVVAGGPSDSRQVYVYARLANKTISWISVGLNGEPATGRTPSISRYGRYVAFASSASNLVIGDANGLSDVFLRDRIANTTRRVSVASTGIEANGASANPSVSDAGRYIAFDSSASNLAVTDTSGTPDTDTNGVSDVFRHDQTTSTTYRVSKASASSPEPNGGSFLPSISGDSKHVVFESDATNNTQYNTDGNGLRDIFTWDAVSGSILPHSVRFEVGVPTGNGRSWGASITNDGAFVAYQSNATDLTPSGDAHTTDIVVHEVGPCINTFADRYETIRNFCTETAIEGAADERDRAYDDCIAAGGTTDECQDEAWNVFYDEVVRLYNECMEFMGLEP
jgi:hypothetical protein